MQMPSEWEQSEQGSQDDDIYPSEEEILKLGKPISWKEIMSESHITTLKDVAIMEKTLSSLVVGETLAIIMFPLLFILQFWGYPDLKLQFFFSFWISFFLLEFLLLQDSFYWR